jgi:hypothetical protein
MAERTEDDYEAMRPGDLLNKYDDLKAELAAAKAGYDGKPKSKDRLNAAKAAVDEFRTYWRGVDVLEGTSGRQAGPFVQTGNKAQEG